MAEESSLEKIPTGRAEEVETFRATFQSPTCTLDISANRRAGTAVAKDERTYNLLKCKPIRFDSDSY